MIVCGVDLKGSEAILSIVTVNAGGIASVPCDTKKLTVGDDRDARVLRVFLQSVKDFARANKIEVFVIKARANGGPMGGGAVSFKMETLIQLSDVETVFVSAVTLSKFAKSNIAGIPAGLNKYQHDAYRCGAYHLNNSGKL